MGNVIDSGKANYGKNVNDTTAVGKYPANGYGLYDNGGQCVGVVSGLSTTKISTLVHRVGIRYRVQIALIGFISNFTGVKTIASCAVARGSMIRRGLRVANRFGGSPAGAVGSFGFRCARSQ